MRQDFYALPETDGAPRSLAVDDLLRTAENEAAPIIRASVTSGRLPARGSPARGILGWFVACQAARSVRTRRVYEVGAELLLRLQLRELGRSAAIELLLESSQVRNPSFERFRNGEIAVEDLEIELDPALYVTAIPDHSKKAYQEIRLS